jgi:hypothetical protein
MKRERGRHGNILAIVLLIIFILVALGFGLWQLSMTEVRHSYRTSDQILATCLANAAFAEAETEIRSKANTEFKQAFINFDKKYTLKLACHAAPETRKLGKILMEGDPKDGLDPLLPPIEIDDIKINAFVYEEAGSLPKDAVEPYDHIRNVKIEAVVVVSGVMKEIWEVLSAKVVDTRPVANEYVLYSEDSDLEGFAAPPGMSLGTITSNQVRFTKELNHKGLREKFEAEMLLKYKECATLVLPTASRLYRGGELWAEGLVFVKDLSLQGGTKVMLPAMLVSDKPIRVGGSIDASNDVPLYHNGIPRLSLVGPSAEVNSTAVVKAGFCMIDSIDSGGSFINIEGNLAVRKLHYNKPGGFTGTVAFDDRFVDKAYLADMKNQPAVGGGTKPIDSAYVVSISPVVTVWLDKNNIIR